LQYIDTTSMCPPCLQLATSEMWCWSAWRKENINKNCLCATVMHIRAVLTGRLTVSGFDLAWFSSLSSKRICVFGLNGAIYTVVQKKRANFGGLYDPVQSILIIFSKLFVNDHKSCLVVKFSTSPHMCCHYTLWNTMLYFALITLLIAKNAPTLYHHNFNKC